MVWLTKLNETWRSLWHRIVSWLLISSIQKIYSILPVVLYGWCLVNHRNTPYISRDTNPVLLPCCISN
jgi:hypothetical protein